MTVDTWTNQGAATILSQGTLTGNGEVKSGGTFHLLDSGTYVGNLTIDPLATASVGVVYMQGNVLNNGTLTGESPDAQFHMQGLLFTNYGTVSTNAFYFEKGSGAVQQVNGSGAWNSGINNLFVTNGTVLAPQNDVTFGPQHFSIGDTWRSAECRHTSSDLPESHNREQRQARLSVQRAAVSTRRGIVSTSAMPMNLSLLLRWLWRTA